MQILPIIEPYTNRTEGYNMKRGTKEFYEVVESFEQGVKSGAFGYISGDLTKDNFNKNTFYANGEVNTAFRFFMAGYSNAKCEYSK
jgi:uncharacterized protein (DUF2252 family)